jgi:parallel beta-helix repeat protein
MIGNRAQFYSSGALEVQGVNGTSITNNLIRDNAEDGIVFTSEQSNRGSTNFRVNCNTVTGSSAYGIHIKNSSNNNTVTNNTVTNNSWGNISNPGSGNTVANNRPTTSCGTVGSDLPRHSRHCRHHRRLPPLSPTSSSPRSPMRPGMRLGPEIPEPDLLAVREKDERHVELLPVGLPLSSGVPGFRVERLASMTAMGRPCTDCRTARGPTTFLRPAFQAASSRSRSISMREKASLVGVR